MEGKKVSSDNQKKPSGQSSSRPTRSSNKNNHGESSLHLNIAGKVVAENKIDHRGSQMSTEEILNFFPNVEDRMKFLTGVITAPSPVTSSSNGITFWQNLPAGTTIEVQKGGELTGGNEIKSITLAIHPSKPPSSS